MIRCVPKSELQFIEAGRRRPRASRPRARLSLPTAISGYTLRHYAPGKRFRNIVVRDHLRLPGLGAFGDLLVPPAKESAGESHVYRGTLSSGVFAERSDH